MTLAAHPVAREDLLRVHAEDAAFLLTQRARAQEMPNYRPLDIYDLEERLRGHLGALIHAGTDGLAIAEETMVESGAGDAASVFLNLSLAAGDDRATRRALASGEKAVEAGEDTALHLLGQAAAMAPDRALRQVMADWISGVSPTARWVAHDVCGWHRVDPGNHLIRGLADPDAGVRARAARLAGELGRVDVASRLDGVDAPEADIATALFGDAGRILARVRENVFPRDPATARGMAELFPLVASESDTKTAIDTLLSKETTRRWGIVAIGATGRADALGSLVGVMNRPLDARVAVSALETITGLIYAHSGLELPVFPEDPEDPAIADNATEAMIEANTPWPDPERTAAWLAAEGARFPRGERLLLGLAAWTFTEPPQDWVMFQSRLRAIALTQATRRPDALLPNHRAPVRIVGKRFLRDWPEAV